jgi:hypothetical protein
MKVIDDKELEVTLKNSTYWKHLSPGQLIWIIGIMEGEGSFSYRAERRKGRETTVTPRMDCRMSDLEVLERLKKYLGSDHIIKINKVNMENILGKDGKPQKQLHHLTVEWAGINSARCGGFPDLVNLVNFYKYRELLEIMKPYYCDRRKLQVEASIIRGLSHIIKQKYKFYLKLSPFNVSRSTRARRIIRWKKNNEAVNKMDSGLCDIVPKRFSFKNQN